MDTTGHTLAGTITAKLAPGTFSTANATTASVALTGKITGPAGLTLNPGSSATGGTLTVTLNNAAGTNDYAGDTTITKVSASNYTLALGAANQIPNGIGKGNVAVAGTLALNGFSETLNGLSGAGTVDGVSGTPALTVVDNNATGSFSGVIQNTAGTLALTKIGSGSQTLSGLNTYGGDTTVAAGTLSLTRNNTLSNSAAVRVAASGATLNLNFTGSDVVDRLYLGGTPQAAGTWGATGNALAANHSALITGSGVLSVTHVGTVGSFSSWATTNHLTGGANDDSDHDGIPNLVEYALADGPTPPLAGKILTFVKRPEAIANGDVSWAIETSATPASRLADRGRISSRGRSHAHDLLHASRWHREKLRPLPHDQHALRKASFPIFEALKNYSHSISHHSKKRLAL